MSDNSSLEELRDWITPNQLCKENPAFTRGWLNHRLFYRQTNGLAVHVKKIGRRLLISRSGFVSWFAASYDDQGEL